MPELEASTIEEEEFVMIRTPRSETEKVSDINAKIADSLRLKQAEAEHTAEVAKSQDAPTT